MRIVPNTSPAPVNPTRPLKVVTCGSFRWPVKTLSDSLSRRVAFAPRPSSVGFLRGLDTPDLLQSDSPRILGSAEVRTYKLKVDLIKAIVESDHDIHLVVSAPGHRFRTLIAELPDSNSRAPPGPARRLR